MGTFWESLTTSEHITFQVLLFSAFISILAYTFCFSDNLYIKKIREKMHGACYIECDTKECLSWQNFAKGEQYFIDDYSARDQHCPMGAWELSHFIFHIFIGYALNIYYSLGVGVGFEIYEHYAYQCSSYFDILLNTVGAIVGVLIRHSLHN